MLTDRSPIKGNLTCTSTPVANKSKAKLKKFQKCLKIEILTKKSQNTKITKNVKNPQIMNKTQNFSKTENLSKLPKPNPKSSNSNSKSPSTPFSLKKPSLSYLKRSTSTPFTVKNSPKSPKLPNSRFPSKLENLKHCEKLKKGIKSSRNSIKPKILEDEKVPTSRKEMKKSPEGFVSPTTFTESVKKAEILLKSPKKLDYAKNEDSTNSSESQKVKSIVENYYKEENLDKPMDRKLVMEEENQTLLPEDIEVIKKIGSGTFARVFLCKSLKTDQKFALKVIDKKKLKTKDLVRYAKNERKILQEVKSDFIVSLKLSFQTKSHCYLLMDYCPGKDICTYLDEESSFSESKARFYL